MADTIEPLAGGTQHVAPGGRLGEARRMQNLTTAEIARQLKLSVWQVEALEAGRYQQLPGAIFVRGFIRNYARLVKLDPEELLRSAGDSLQQPVARPEAPPTQDIPFPPAEKPRWPKYAAAIVVVLGALAAYEFRWIESEPGPRPATVASSPAAKPKAELASATSPANAATPSAASAAPVVVIAPAVVPPVPAPASAEPVAAPVPARGPGERQVRFVFTEECWVEIRDRQDRVIFSQLNHAGTAQQVSGVPPLSVVVGNARGTRMTYDDQPVDLVRHTKIDVARLTLE